MWDDIKKISGAKFLSSTSGYGESVLLPVPGLNLPETWYWMIGQYKDQTRLATALRQNQAAQDFLTQRNVRYGLRNDDQPSAVGTVREERYGVKTIGLRAGQTLVAQRVQPLSVPVRPGLPAPVNRKGDEQGNVKKFWDSQTPQSHHIVEFNHLRDLGVSHENGVGPMDHGQLPCVLLMAEFHQRYISSILKQTHGWDAARLRANLAATYSSLYVAGGAPFKPLWEVSKIILRAAGFSVT